ncbi:hypothetical protein BDN72DRAFT_451962 [Pluteus cervinus]|uniref:Uncharacterized protein n=1 Tax=Pluteus cervinus TaxID=181527 RepID=A0ACD3BDK6_9AGAR|nr:hypothetical protein BDN72DRAFT_451962 [Pluteus cervinus]
MDHITEKPTIVSAVRRLDELHEGLTLQESRFRWHFPHYGAFPASSHRHATPSAPWPWLNVDDEPEDGVLNNNIIPPVPPPCDHSNCMGKCWLNYPQSRFPNWDALPVARSRIRAAIENQSDTTIYNVVIDRSGRFTREPNIQAIEEDSEDLWDTFRHMQRDPRPHLRVLFVGRVSGQTFQMIGGGYDIEPYFFSSALNRIPSRYQEAVGSDGDHLTIVMPFIRSTKTIFQPAAGHHEQAMASWVTTPSDCSVFDSGWHSIDTRKPLVLRAGSGEMIEPKQIGQDILAVHLIRNTKGSTMISYHPHRGHSTGARYLGDRLLLAGRSVYWQNILRQSSDPTFVLLVLMWHALYCWDEAMEHLYEHICNMELRVIISSDMEYTREVHVIRAHLLHYESLLQEFRKTVEFIARARHPAFDSHVDSGNEAASSHGSVTLDGLVWTEQKHLTQRLMETECSTLLCELERLELTRIMQDKRLKNVMNLVYSSVSIDDSKRMAKMTEASVRDSAGNMKQIAYLTMIFLPSSFVAAFFGMNIVEINPGTNGNYEQFFLLALGLTAITIWVIVAFQSRYLYPPQTSILRRLGWPVELSWRFFMERIVLRYRLRKFKSTTGIVDGPYSA